jgi:hypothetical protein
MNVGWSVRQALPQFPQKLTFACGAISDAEGQSATSSGLFNHFVSDPQASCPVYEAQAPWRS